jgi:TolA-binding protein
MINYDKIFGFNFALIFKMDIRRIYIILFLIGFIGCSPVRNTYYRQSDKNSSEQSENSSSIKEDKVKKKKVNVKDRFSDTTVIVVDPVKRSDILDKYVNAVRIFDKEDFDKASIEFKQLTETLPPDDSIYFESKFFFAECNISTEKLKEAEVILQELLDDAKIPLSVLEKVLVRLGQVYCVIEKKAKAKELFTRLKSEFPSSMYLKIANCEAVKK